MTQGVWKVLFSDGSSLMDSLSTPPLSCNIKTDRRFHHKRTGALLCTTGMNWSDPEYLSTYSDWFFHSNSASSTKVKLRSREMVIPGDHWPVFLYAGYEYDAEDPWKGLFKSLLLESVSRLWSSTSIISVTIWHCIEAYKYIFTSPSSVDRVTKATRSGNARIHGMTCVTPASIAYIATQVWT